MKHSFDKLTAITQTYTSKSKPLDELILRLKGKPFYCNRPFKSVNEYCCLWHTFPPKKPDGSYSELYPFQQSLVTDIQTYKFLALLKARNLGATQIALAYGLYLTLCLQLPGNYMFITGVGYILSRTLCRRAKAMLATKGVYTDDNVSTITFPHCRWMFYGSDSKTYLGQSEVSYLVADEIASFDPYSDWKGSIDTFAIKNAGATIFLITTPAGRVGSTAHRVFTETDDKSLYHRVYLSFREALGSMLSPESIRLLQKTSESFDMMYDLKWGFVKRGTMLSSKSLDDALSKQYNIEDTTVNINAPKSMGIDYGATGSTGLGGGFGCVVTAFEDGTVKVLDAKLWTNSEYFEVLEDIRNMVRTYDPVKIYLDGSAVSFCRSLKLTPEINEDPNYQDQIKMYRQMKIDYQNNMRVLPINWVKSQTEMVSTVQMLFNKNAIAVSPTLDKLVTALRTATIEGLRLQKDVSQFNDLTDSLFLACLEYQEVRT
jgi:hypothetical protein